MSRSTASDRSGRAESLTVKRVFAAPRSRVFEAWTNPETLARFWRPIPGEYETTAEVDLRVGGAWQVEMRFADGGAVRLFGELLEVDPPRRLVYTWSSAGKDRDEDDALVTVELAEHGTETEVVLTHERIETAAARQQLEAGWTSILDELRGTCARLGD